MIPTILKTILVLIYHLFISLSFAVVIWIISIMITQFFRPKEIKRDLDGNVIKDKKDHVPWQLNKHIMFLFWGTIIIFFWIRLNWGYFLGINTCEWGYLLIC